MLEKVDPGVGGLPQGGQVCHAHRLLVLVSDHVINVGVGVRELLECLAFCGEEKVYQEQRFLCDAADLTIIPPLNGFP